MAKSSEIIKKVKELQNIDLDDVLLGKKTGAEENIKLKRIKSVKPKFEIWLPYTKGGQDIKDALCESGLAVRGNLNVLYSFLLLVFCYTFILEIANVKNVESFLLIMSINILM